MKKKIIVIGCKIFAVSGCFSNLESMPLLQSIAFLIFILQVKI